MPATLTAASLLRDVPSVPPAPSDLRPSHAGLGTTPPVEAPAGAMDSSALLQGQKAVAINHNGAVYRLQATKLGKLILTK